MKATAAEKAKKFVDQKVLRPRLVKDRNAALTHRQRTILQLLADGCRYDAIAAQLGCAKQTIKRATWSAMNRLGASTLAQAVAMALRRGLIT